MHKAGLLESSRWLSGFGPVGRQKRTLSLTGELHRGAGSKSTCEIPRGGSEFIMSRNELRPQLAETEQACLAFAERRDWRCEGSGRRRKSHLCGISCFKTTLRARSRSGRSLVCRVAHHALSDDVGAIFDVHFRRAVCVDFRRTALVRYGRCQPCQRTEFKSTASIFAKVNHP